MLHWIEKNKSPIIKSLIFFICFFILVGKSLSPQGALDTYWHLQMGRDLLENGFSPWVDTYSFTHNGNEVSSVPYLFQMTLAFFVSIFGEITAYFILKLTYITVLLYVISRYFKHIKAPWFVVLTILPILTYFIQIRLIIRPDTFANILVVICLILYLKARDNFAKKELLLICLLLIFWGNYHTPIIGYIIILGLFFDRAIHKLVFGNANFTWLQWLVWGGVVFLVGFINPSFNHTVIQYLTLSNDWSKYLSEYYPSMFYYSNNKMVQLLWVSSICLVYWSIIKKHYGFALLVAIFGYYSWAIVRLVPVASYINFCIFAFYLSQVNFNLYLSSLSSLRRFLVLTSFTGFIVFTFYQAYDKTYYRLISLNNYSNHAQHMRKIMDGRYPVEVADYLKEFQRGGNLLNTFNMGGYLIYALSPDYKVFIDGRTNILYPLAFYKHYLDVIRDINALESDVIKYDIQYAVFENSNKSQMYFSGTDLLTVNFANENYILYSNDKKVAFPLASKFTLFPMCWNDRFLKQVESEILLSEELFTEKKYLIKSILKLLSMYRSEKNKSDFIDIKQVKILKSDITKRLAVYLAINIENYDLSMSALKSLSVKRTDDILMMAYVLVMLEDYRSANNVMAAYFNKKGGFIDGSYSNFEKIFILKILMAVHENKNRLENVYFDIDIIKDKLNIKGTLVEQSQLKGLPYNEVCRPIFKSY